MIRQITPVVARATDLAGSALSAAAIVTISAPPNAKITTTTAPRIDPNPLGANPPCATRFDSPPVSPGHSPATHSSPRMMNDTMAATLMPENQNSNSPNHLTEIRLVAVITTISSMAMTHSGSPTQTCRICAPATASTAMMIT